MMISIMVFFLTGALFAGAFHVPPPCSMACPRHGQRHCERRIQETSALFSSYNQQSLLDRVTTTSTTTPTIMVNFPQTWVPMGSVYELDGTKPNSVYFFGQEYIIYQNTKSQDDIRNHGWCVIDSACPHRLAPLREGRIVPETQEIQCSYHGWTFDGTNQGRCTSIPQLEQDHEKTQRILSNAKCSITSYPCIVEKNILWAWLWPDHDHALTYTHLPEYYLDHIPLNSTATFTRILPYSYDTLVENILDISHVPFAHHSLQGTRNDSSIVKPMVNTTIETLTMNNNNGTLTELSPADGFVFSFTDHTRKQTRAGTCTFKAPYMVHYNATFVDTSNPFTLTTLLIPVSAGHSKIIIFSLNSNITSASTSTDSNRRIETLSATVATNHSDNSTSSGRMNHVVTSTTVPKKSFNLRQLIFSAIFPRLPIWFLHTFSNRFLDSDLMLLHDQEIDLRSRLTDGWSQSLPENDRNSVRVTSKPILEQYFMPSKADRSVVAIRKWISRYASAVYDLSQPSHNTNPLPYKDRKLLFDRYNQHTKQCKHCNTMLETTLPKYKTYSYTLLSISILLWNRHFLFRLLSVGCIMSFRMYHWIENKLRYGDFDHSRNH